MVEKVKSTIEKHKLINDIKPLIVAVSGGADSMVMLDVLLRLQADYGYEIKVAHVNHLIRGAEADRDQEAVVSFCKKHGLDLALLKCDIPALASYLNIGIEECGRQVRYDFFKKLAPDSLIATAHTLNDSIETTVFNLVRGTGLTGLCGIKAKNNELIRPLIECSREEVEAYAGENDILYYDDSSNLETDYTRNYIRHNVVSSFSHINEKYERSFKRLFVNLSEDEALLNELTEDLLNKSRVTSGYKADVLLKAPSSLLSRALINILEKYTGVAPEQKHVERLKLLLRESGDYQFRNTVTLRCRDNLLFVAPSPYVNLSWKIEDVGNRVEVNSKIYEFSIINRIDFERLIIVNNTTLENCLDYDNIKGKFSLRSRQVGDYFALPLRGCGKSVKKLFNEAKIPPELRDKVAILADDTGPVWIEGFGPSANCAISDISKKILLVKIRSME